MIRVMIHFVVTSLSSAGYSIVYPPEDLDDSDSCSRAGPAHVRSAGPSCDEPPTKLKLMVGATPSNTEVGSGWKRHGMKVAWGCNRVGGDGVALGSNAGAARRAGAAWPELWQRGRSW